MTHRHPGDTALYRRASFVMLVRDEDVLQAVTGLSDDALVDLGYGLALEAFEGRWEGTRELARARYGIPPDVLELLAAAALATLLPAMGTALLARPTDGQMRALCETLGSFGFTLTNTSGQPKGRTPRATSQTSVTP